MFWVAMAAVLDGITIQQQQPTAQISIAGPTDVAKVLPLKSCPLGTSQSLAVDPWDLGTKN